MAALSEHKKYILKLVVFFTISLFTQAIPHELGHLLVAKLLGFQIMGIHWALFDPSFVTIGLVFNPILFKLVLVSGGWSVCIFMYVAYSLSRGPALRKVTRVFILYGFLGGLFEALYTHVYSSVSSLSVILLAFCITITFAYDDFSKHFTLIC